MVAAGVGDDASLSFVVREGSDFVVGATEFEGADGLLVLGLEQEATWVFGRRAGGLSKFDQVRAGGDAVEARLGGVEVV